MTSVPFGATHSGLMAGLGQRPAAVNVTLLAVMLITGVLLFGLGKENIADRATTPVRFKTAISTVSESSRNTEAAGDHDAYTTAALRNLTDFRDRVLAIGIPFFGVAQASKGKYNATNLWKLLEPIITCPPDQPLTRYGPGGDGSKQLCQLQEQRDDAPCVIYSLGSNGEFSFEWSVMNTTSCSVDTFDCTINGTSQGPRHRYHNWCIGDAKHGPNFRSWANITATLGHSKVDVMKIDIEGHEYKVFSDLRSRDPTLPRQIAVEFHFQNNDAHYPYMAHSGAELALTYLHLAQLGYAGIAQEVNPIAPECCSEVSFFKVV